MNIDSLRDYCRTFPNVSENIQWGNDLVLKVGPKQGGKMFVVACLDPSAPHRCSFKCTPEEFVELQERDGVVPAPYLARAQWVALERFDALSDAELRRLLRQAYALVAAKMSRGGRGGSRGRRETRTAEARRRGGTQRSITGRATARSRRRAKTGSKKR